MFYLFVVYRAEVQFYCVLAVCFAMLRWGGGPERAIALVWLFWMEAADAAYHAISDLPMQLDSIDPFHAAIDGLAAVIFVLIALYANRFYPLVIAAFQLLSAMSHLARELAEAITPIAYAVMIFAPSWGILIAMIVGFSQHIKRQRKFGIYRSWRGNPPLFLDRLSPTTVT